MVASGTGESPILQEGNNLAVTQIQPKQSRDLEDNHIGQMITLVNISALNLIEFVNVNNNYGFKLLRLTIDWFDWPEAESTGNYSRHHVDPGQDQVVNGLIDNGIKIRYTLLYWDENLKVDWDRQDYSRYKTEEDIQGYLNYLKFIVNHFKGRLEYLEILNEPNVPRGQNYVEVADYINLVKRAIPVIREEDPAIKIAVGAVSSIEEPSSRDYLFSILSSEVMPLVDAVSWHLGSSYSPEEATEFYYNYPSLVQEIKSVASSHGFGGEYIAEELIWVTHGQSFPWGHPPYYYSEAAAAKYYARGIVMHLGMDLTTEIGLNPPGSDPLIERTVRNLCTVMAGAEPTSLPIEIQSEATNMRNCSFSLSNGDTLVALWTDGIAVEEDPGVKTNLTLPGFTAQDVVGIDALNGLQQVMMASNENGNLTIQNLIVRDYPLILRLSPVAEPPLITYSIITLIVLIIITVLIIIAYRKNRNKR